VVPRRSPLRALHIKTESTSRLPSSWHKDDHVERAALNGYADWVREEPELGQLDAQVLRTVDREAQQRVIRQMERPAHGQAYFLFLYNPIKLFAVNKSVEFRPDAIPYVSFKDTAVTAQHWSIRQRESAMQE
jgi:ABC-type transport system substrate-binding protein